MLFFFKASSSFPKDVSFSSTCSKPCKALPALSSADAARKSFSSCRIGAMQESTASLAANRPSPRSSTAESTLLCRSSMSALTSLRSAPEEAFGLTDSFFSLSSNSFRRASTWDFTASIASDLPSLALARPCRSEVMSLSALAKRDCRSLSSFMKLSDEEAPATLNGPSPPKLTSDAGPGEAPPMVCPSPPKRRSISATRSASSSTTSKCSATASSFSWSALGASPRPLLEAWSASAFGSGGTLLPCMAEPASEIADRAETSPKFAVSFSRTKSMLPSTSRSLAAMSAT
mmetsp:Transcript_75499/g.133246  ORF Transcript_75499/g.133246 Transcript_75499/m.133246 type:complete len:289 (-) Transcript_75499:872-1738(-)